MTNVPDAFEVLKEESTRKLFSSLGVLNENEIEARYEVLNETYVKKLQIEARVIGDICINHVIPAAVSYQNLLIRNVEGLKAVFGDEYKELCRSEIATLRDLSGYINRITDDVKELVERRKKANRIADMAQRAKTYSRDVKEQMDKVRDSADRLEMIVDDELWPLPKYRELLFF